MPAYVLFPARDEQRRSDQLNVAVAFGATPAAARNAAETLLGEPGALAGWNVVDVSTAAQPAVFASGLLVGARAQSVWPNLDRGGSYLRGT
jgi:hypothetical protein